MDRAADYVALREMLRMRGTLPMPRTSVTKVRCVSWCELGQMKLPAPATQIWGSSWSAAVCILSRCRLLLPWQRVGAKLARLDSVLNIKTYLLCSSGCSMCNVCVGQTGVKTPGACVLCLECEKDVVVLMVLPVILGVGQHFSSVYHDAHRSALPIPCYTLARMSMTVVSAKLRHCTRMTSDWSLLTSPFLLTL